MFPVQLNGDASGKGPVQFWDVSSGREVRRQFDEASSLSNTTLSRDGLLLAALVDYAGPAATTHLHLVEIDTGRESTATVLPRSPHWAIHFSPDSNLLLMEGNRWVEWNGATAPKPSLLLFDTQSLRLLAQVTGEQWRWHWAPDGDALLLYSGGTATLRRVTATKETSVVLNDAGDWLGITPDGRTLLTAQTGELPSSSLLLWDTATGKRRGVVPHWAPGVLGDPGQGMILNGRALVTAQKGPAGETMAVVWDIATHAPLAKVPLDNRFITMFPERDVFALFQSVDPQHLAMYRPQPFAQLWQRDLPNGIFLRIDSLSGTDLLAVVTQRDGAPRLELLNINTGIAALDVPMLQPHHHLMPRGRLLAVVETISLADRGSPLNDMLDRCFALMFRAPVAGTDFETTTRVFDTKTGVALCQFSLRDATFADFSADGQSLLMYSDDRNGDGATLSCYDIPPRRYWAWIIGVPLAFGALLLSLRAGWRRLRRRSNRDVPRQDSPGRAAAPFP